MKKLILHSHVQWNIYFVEMFYFKSETAQWPVKKTFKLFPVEPSMEYVDIVISGYSKGDFSRVDVMVEFVNMNYELDELRNNHELSSFQRDRIHDYAKNRCKELNIIL